MNTSPILKAIATKILNHDLANQQAESEALYLKLQPKDRARVLDLVTQMLPNWVAV